MKKDTRTNRGRTAGVITAAALISIFIYSFVVSLTNTIINEIVGAFSLTGASEGLMSSMVSLGFMLSLFLIPLAQGRVQKIPALIAACVIQAAMLFGSGASPAFALFCLMCVILGFSGGFIDTYANSAVVDAWGAQSPKYLGYLHGLFGLGSLLTPIVIFRLLLYTDWRGIYYIMAVISLLTAPVVFLLTRGCDKGAINAATNEQRLNKADLLSFMRQRRNIMLSLAAFFSTVVQASLMVWIVRYMVLRFDAAHLGALSLSAYWVCATLNRFFLAQLINKAPLKFFILGAVLSGAAFAIGVSSGSPIVMCAMAGVLGLSGGHFIPVLISECARGYAGKTTFTTSYMMLVMGFARIIVPLLLAYATTRVSPAFSMMIPVWAAPAAAVFGWMALRAQL